MELLVTRILYAKPHFYSDFSVANWWGELLDAFVNFISIVE